MELKLILSGLAKAYPGRPVFSNINAEVFGGKKLVITGSNGSGKSTLMKVICGFIRPTKGKVSLIIDGKEYDRLEIRPHIGLVAPELVLYDELTALENLQFFAGIAGLNFSIGSLKEKLAEIGLAGRGGDYVGAYSSGMKVRLKYCLALLSRPELLLLDEPTSNLDDLGKELVDGIINNHDGITVIATNEKTELNYGDEVIRLDQ